MAYGLRYAQLDTPFHGLAPASQWRGTALRITFLIRTLSVGGAERQLIYLARSLNQRGHRVLVVVFYGDGPLQPELERAGVPLVVVGKSGRWDVVGFLIRLTRALRAERPEILHGYLSVANLLCVSLRPLLPGTKIVWGIRASNMDFSRYDRLAAIVDRLEARLSRRADRIISNSNAGKEDAVGRGFPADRTVVVPNGIDTERFAPNRAAGAELRRAWSVCPNEKLIGLVCRIDPMKDHPTFLRAAAIAIGKRPDLRFVCVGRGRDAYTDEMKRLSDELGLADHVIWAGSRSDMPAVYNALDILTSASRFGEGFSNVVGEAMSAETPCVVTDCGDSAWIVADTGIVTPKEDPARLAEAWKRMLDQDTTALGVRARRRIVAEFSLDGLTERTESALMPLLSG